MRQSKMVFVGLASTILAAMPAQAASLFTSLSSWQAAVGSFQRDTSYGTNFSSISNLTLDGGATLGFDSAVNIRTIGDGWLTWSGGYTGQVLRVGASSLSISLNALGGLGFFVEPDRFLTFDFTLQLSDGSTTSAAYDGISGAGFLGFVGAGITGVTVTTTDTSFGLGDFYVATDTAAVPEPASWALMVSSFGLIGGGLRRRRSQAARVAVRFS